MTTVPLVQIHQYNDPEILEFFNVNRVEYRLVGDHLFVIRCREEDVAAGPGDWLVLAGDGEVEVEPGPYSHHRPHAWAGPVRERGEIVTAGG